VAWKGNLLAIGRYYNSFEGDNFMEAHVFGKSFDPETVEWTLLPNLCTNRFRYVKNANVIELFVVVVEDKLYVMKPQMNEVVQLRPEFE
ncbi:hypothetical protein KI387_041443, partial [Taxus chinensis]